MEQLNRIVKNAGIVFLGIMISKLLGYAFRLLVARIGVSEYGLYNLGVTVLNIAFLIGSAGLLTGVTRFTAQYLGERRRERIAGVLATALRIALPFSLLCSGAVMVGAPWIASWFRNAELVPVLRIIGMLVPLAVLMEIFLSVTDAFQKMHLRVLATDIFGDLSKLLLAALFVMLGYGLFGALWALALSMLFSCILSGIFLARLGVPLRAAGVDWELLRYSYPNFLSKFLGVVYGWVDTIMIGILMSVTAVGLYSAALPTAMLLLIAPTCILSIFLPMITDAHFRKKSIQPVYHAVTKWIFLLNLPLAVFLVCFAQPLLTVLFGTVYSEAHAALVLLSIAFFVHAVGKANGYIPHLFKRTDALLAITLFGVALNIVLNLFLISRMGITGAALATAVSYAGVSIAQWVVSRRLLPLSFLNWSYAKAGVAAVLPFSILAALSRNHPQTVWSLVAIAAIGLVCYVGLLRYLRCFERSDRYLISNVLRRIGIERQWVERVLG